MKTVIDIYGIINTNTNKIYIGQTKNGYRKRFIQHLCPKDGSPRLSASVHKHGKDSFSCELLDIAFSQEEADIKEKMWIAALGTYKEKNGYNLSLGGCIGQFNRETLAKMSASKTGENNNFFGKKHSIEARRKMSKWKKEHYQLQNHPRSKRILCIETGKIYECVVEAGADTGANHHHIGAVANGRYGRKTAGGYHWKWIN